MKKILFLALLAVITSCNIKLPIQVSYGENSKQLNEFEKKLDANNPKEKFLVSFIGVYKDDLVILLVDGKEVFHKKLKNEQISNREFVDFYVGDKPKENIQIFINDQSVSFNAKAIEERRYIYIDKDNAKKIFLSKSPVFKGSDNFYDEQPRNNRQRGYLKVTY
jgi:hypothetical protein